MIIIDGQEWKNEDGQLPQKRKVYDHEFALMP
jgi:hypothetical protein